MPCPTYNRMLLIANDEFVPAEDCEDVDIDPGEYFVLSEVATTLGVSLSNPDTQAPLFCFLEQLGAQVAAGGRLGTMILDRRWYVARTVWIPPTLTIAGVGIQGEGSIVGVGDLVGRSIVALRRLGPNEIAGEVTLRDLHVEPGGLGGHPSPNFVAAVDDPVAGISVVGARDCLLQNVLVSSMTVNVYGAASRDVTVERCVLSAGSYDLVLGADNHGWRIRDTSIQHADCWGARVFGAADVVDLDAEDADVEWGEDFVFDACRVEGNDEGGILTAGFGTVIMNTRFEGNGGLQPVGSLHVAVRIAAAPLSTSPTGIQRRSGEVRLLGSWIDRPRALRTPGSHLAVEGLWPTLGYGVRTGFTVSAADQQGIEVIPPGSPDIIVPS